MTVSYPENFEVEILDLVTGFGYCYRGKCVDDCVNWYLNLFFGKRAYKVTRISRIGDDFHNE